MVLSDASIFSSIQPSRAFSTVHPRFLPEVKACSSFFGIVEFSSARADLARSSCQLQPSVMSWKPIHTPIMQISRAASISAMALARSFRASSGIIAHPLMPQVCWHCFIPGVDSFGGSSGIQPQAGEHWSEQAPQVEDAGNLAHNLSEGELALNETIQHGEPTTELKHIFIQSPAAHTTEM